MVDILSSRVLGVARRLLARSEGLTRVVWPSPDESLKRRRDGTLVASALFTALAGRDPDPEERAELLKGDRQTLTVQRVMEELSARPEILDRRVATDLGLVRELLELNMASEEGRRPRSTARILYLHIMKTAGTSLSELLSRWAGPERSRVGIPLDDLVVMPMPLLASMRVLAGHIPFEAIDMLPSSFQTVTVLRDPLERTLSHYRELRRRHKDDLTLDEFLHSEVYDVPSGNYQARCLAHTIDLGRAWVSYSPSRRYLQAGGRPDEPYPLQSLFDSTPLTMDDDELLRRSVRNLSSIDFVGVTEELEQLTRRLAERFGVPPASAPRLNTSRRTEHPELTDRLRQRVQERTEVDRELYEHARKVSGL